MQAPAPHETPHAPQWAGSRWRSTQAALQVSIHAVPHVPLVHVARSNTLPAGQVVQPAPHAAATPSPTQLPVAPPQRVFPAAQVVLHEVPSHVGTEPGTPSAQRVHVAPQAFTSVALAHSPLHGLNPVAQVYAQALLVQTGAPPSGAVHVEHEGPHAVVDVAGAQTPLQRLKPVVQVTSHWPVTHAAAPFAVPGQGTQLLPHVSGAVSETQAMPQRWKPVLQTKSHASSVVHVAVPFAGAGHAMHRLPHDAGAVSRRHWSPQRWYPLSHSKSQSRLVHLGMEFMGKAQGPHRVPHEFTAVSSTQVEPQTWVPGRHVTPQAPAEHVAMPLVAGQGLQREPHVATSSSAAQETVFSPVTHRWKPVGHEPASGRTRSHRFSAQVSVSSQVRQKRAPVPHAALSLPGLHSPADVQQPSGQVARLQGGFSWGQPANAAASNRRTQSERTTRGLSFREVGPAASRKRHVM